MSRRNPCPTKLIRLSAGAIEEAWGLARKLGNDNPRWVIESCLHQILEMAAQPPGTREIPPLVLMSDVTRAKPILLGETRSLERTVITEPTQRN